MTQLTLDWMFQESLNVLRYTLENNEIAMEIVSLNLGIISAKCTFLCYVLLIGVC